ncbi:hypothetical protein pdam_00014177 [Pocillopora damicornis]|uniref:Uncharacterized protein n=1 Tax=Pocillopora damicornis TaxID=46731 RepID=A0A3M6V4X7_POCDA|nr:hypothetical protein pdam_00014177 [Pocillopora damicornis]
MAFVQLYSLALFVASTKSSSMYNMYSNMIMPDGKENYNVSDNCNEAADTLEFMVQLRRYILIAKLRLSPPSFHIHPEENHYINS